MIVPTLEDIKIFILYISMSLWTGGFFLDFHSLFYLSPVKKKKELLSK